MDRDLILRYNPLELSYRAVILIGLAVTGAIAVYRSPNYSPIPDIEILMSKAKTLLAGVMETLSTLTPNISTDFLLAQLPFTICALCSLTEFTREVALHIQLFLGSANESNIRLAIPLLRIFFTAIYSHF